MDLARAVEKEWEEELVVECNWNNAKAMATVQGGLGTTGLAHTVEEEWEEELAVEHNRDNVEATATVQGGSGTAGLARAVKEEWEKGLAAECNWNNAEATATVQGGSGTVGLARAVEEEWEKELEDHEQGRVEVRAWDDLCDQIKMDLAKGSKTLPLSQVNQLLLIRNFTTLRLKGLGCIEASLEIARQWHECQGLHFAQKIQALARHYQVFEQLPIEKCSGHSNALSPLKDKRLQLAAREWLTSQAVGQVTPKDFRHALNTAILPLLGINLQKELCKHTA